jgi:hypothetical protein
MKNTFVPGTRVAETFDKQKAMKLFAYGDIVRCGVVVECGQDYDRSLLSPSETSVVVKWDGYKYCSKTDIDDLMLEVDVDKKLAPIEEEFNDLTKDIEAKMKLAGQAIRMANKIAKELGVENLSSLDCVSPLLKAMDDVGWRTSSLSC